MAIPVQPAQTLATMIFDGVFERFPDLRVGVVEQGAIWVPSWMRQMESIDAFGRREAVAKLSLRPSEYVRRQMKFTPYPTEDVDGLSNRRGQKLCCFHLTIRTSKADAGRLSVSSVRLRTALTRFASGSIRQLDDLMGGRLGSLLAA